MNAQASGLIAGAADGSGGGTSTNSGAQASVSVVTQFTIEVGNADNAFLAGLKEAMQVALCGSQPPTKCSVEAEGALPLPGPCADFEGALVDTELYEERFVGVAWAPLADTLLRSVHGHGRLRRLC